MRRRPVPLTHIMLSEVIVMKPNSIYTDISDFIFLEEVPEKSDVIFIPGGSYCELPELAAELFKQNLAPLIIPSGKYAKGRDRIKEPISGRDRYTGDYLTEADFFTDVLVQNGVPRENILEENEAEYTCQNAQFSRRLLDAQGIKIKSAIIVCKAFHARRSYMYYQREFPGVTFYVVPAKTPYPGIQKDNWYLSEIGRKRVYGELERIGTQFVI